MAPYSPPDSVEAGQRRQLWGALLVILLAVAMVNLPPGPQEALASGLRATLLRPFLGLQSVVVAARARTARVEILQARLDSATARAMARSTLAEENRRLKALLGLSQRAGPRWQAARVLRPGTQGSESIFLLDRGREHGLERWAPVVTREGLAGMVREVRRGNAVGMDWTHPDFRASAMSEDGTVYGFVEPRRGIFREQDRLLLTGTPFSTRLDSGAVILTSGVGGVFPRGVPVGRVVELADAEGGWRTSYWLQPFVQPGDLVHVLVARARPGIPAEEGEAPRPDSAAGPGPGSPPVDDLARVWPPELRGTRLELETRTGHLLDSLEVLRLRLRTLEDSLAGSPSLDSAPGAGVEPGATPSGGGGER
jgi:rod shape-determining protein MreC